MSYIDRMLKKPEILLASSLLNHQTEYSREEIRNFMNKKTDRKYKRIPPNFTSLILSHHAFKRWNERVGPFIDYQELNNLLRQLFFLGERIKLISDKRGLIDSDIVFYYTTKLNTIYITTFYGRLSVHPVLNNIRDLKEFLAVKDEKVDLQLADELLRKQILPPVPIECIKFKGKTTLYRLEKYKVEEDKELFFLSETKNALVKSGIEINPENPFRPLLNKSVLYILKKMGYRQFVKEHLHYHKPQAVQHEMEKERERNRKKEMRNFL